MLAIQVLFNKNLQINICTGNKSEQLFPIHGNNNQIQQTTLFRVIHQSKRRNNTFITNSIMNVTVEKKNPGKTLCIFLSSSKMISIDYYVSICGIFQSFEICNKRISRNIVLSVADKLVPQKPHKLVFSSLGVRFFLL